MLRSLIILFIISILSKSIFAQLPPVFDKNLEKTVETFTLSRKYLSPTKITWKTPNSEKNILNVEKLLLPGSGQADLEGGDLCFLKSEGTMQPAILLDFGKEIHGGIQIVTGMYKSFKPINIRLRFGESVAEAMSNIGDSSNATNDHAIRDLVVPVPWLGKLEIGNTGFRFLRIDLLDKDAELLLKEVRAIFVYRDIPYLGSFNSSDSLLNKIWMTGAYTVHLNMQEYLWDGIKRDRLVWIGDAHPEISTIAAVFGNNEVVPKSLDFTRDITKLPAYMNTMITYSMWWVIIHRDYYMHNGDLKYLKQQQSYLVQLLNQYMSKIGQDDKEHLDNGTRFIDWPSSTDVKATDAGIQALLVLTMDAGAELCNILGDKTTAAKCQNAAARLRKHVPDANNSKQAAALLALAEIVPAEKANKEIISVGGAKNFSTFFGYYMLQAMAKAGDYDGALDIIRTYWGSMLQLGATTFWEDFNIDWLPNASRIDELPKPGQVDIHGGYGKFCYVGYRHSFAHGWASGPTPWLTEHVLGIKPIAPGCKTIQVRPHLGNLNFAEGTYSTPYGILKVKHTKLANGKIQSEISAPKGVTVVR